MRVAALAWTIEPCDGVASWLAHARRVLGRAQDADLAVLPELHCLELLGNQDLLSGEALCAFLARAHDPWVEFCASYSKQFRVRLVGGSHVARTDRGYVNRAVVAELNGDVWFQDKLVLTQWEANDWGLVAGTGQTVRDGLGVAVCYDSEFSRVFEGLSDQGATVVAVPSFTETEHGRYRVENCCRARATEFQCVVALAPLRGELGREPVPSTTGQPTLFVPSAGDFPATGVLAVGSESAVGHVDLIGLSQCRESGDVRNYQDQRWLRGGTPGG